MKLYQSAATLLLLALLSAGYGQRGSAEEHITAQTKTVAANSASNPAPNSAQSVLDEFISSLKPLSDQVKQDSKEPIDLTNFNKNLTELKKNKNSVSEIDSVLNLKTLDSLEKIKSIPRGESSPQKVQITELQKSLIEDGEELDLSQGQGIFGFKTSKALSNFLEAKLLPAVRAASVKDSSPAIPEQTNPVVPQQSNFSPLAIAALAASILSLVANAVLFFLLRDSSIRIKKLEEKRREDKDKLNNLSISTEKNIKTLLAQQSETDRKLQQQRQQAKAASYSSPSQQPYSEGGQVEYGSNMPPAQKSYPFVSPERQPYAAVSAPQRDYQSPKPAHEVIAQQYNSNPNSIATSAQGVSETEDSIYRRRRDSSVKEVTLQNVSNYSYWVITDGEGGYWLTPIADLKLNPMNFDTFQALFQSNGEPLSGRLQLIKPAKVTQATANQWELVEHGEVQFL